MDACFGGILWKYLPHVNSLYIFSIRNFISSGESDDSCGARKFTPKFISNSVLFFWLQSLNFL